MTAPALALDRADRVAVLWGGGLGDLLVIRPLLQRLAARLARPADFVCASFVAPGVAAAAGAPVTEVPVPRAPGAALAAARRLGPYRLVYLGPHPTWRTHALAAAVRGAIWSRPGGGPHEFIGDTLWRDVVSLGLADPSEAPQPYGTRPLFAGLAPEPPPIGAPYLVAHLTARPHWQAKQWPGPLWREVLRRVLAETPLHVVCVGTAPEHDAIAAQLAGLDASRLRLETGLSLPQLEQRVLSSVGVICHNSGVMHVAAALRKPTVALAGSSPRWWWPSMPWVLSLTSGRCGLECNQHRCPVPLFHAKCIRALGVDQVHDAVRRHILRHTA